MKKLLLIFALLIAASGFALAQSVKGLEMHGYVQSRFYANPDKASTFSVERVSISAKADLPEDAKLYVEFNFHPWVSDKVVNNVTAEQSRNYLESAYADFPIKDGFLRIGKGRALNFGITPVYGARKTAQYGSVAETFTQDRITGVQYSLSRDNFEGGISVYNAPRVGVRGLGSYPVAGDVVRHICERDDNANLTGKLAVAGKAGWKYSNFSWHLSAASGKMTDADTDRLASYYDSEFIPGTAPRTMSKYGLDASYNKGNFFASAEAYKGKYSRLHINGVGIILGYEPKNRPRFYCAFNSLSNNLAPTPAQETWDTKQTILGYVYPISKGIWAELNYVNNRETPFSAMPKVKNDLLFVELFTSI